MLAARNDAHSQPSIRSVKRPNQGRQSGERVGAIVGGRGDFQPQEQPVTQHGGPGESSEVLRIARLFN